MRVKAGIAIALFLFSISSAQGAGNCLARAQNRQALPRVVREYIEEIEGSLTSLRNDKGHLEASIPPRPTQSSTWFSRLFSSNRPPKVDPHLETRTRIWKLETKMTRLEFMVRKLEEAKDLPLNEENKVTGRLEGLLLSSLIERRAYNEIDEIELADQLLGEFGLPDSERTIQLYVILSPKTPQRFEYPQFSDKWPMVFNIQVKRTSIGEAGRTLQLLLKTDDLESANAAIERILSLSNASFHLNHRYSLYKDDGDDYREIGYQTRYDRKTGIVDMISHYGRVQGTLLPFRFLGRVLESGGAIYAIPQ